MSQTRLAQLVKTNHVCEFGKNVKKNKKINKISTTFHGWNPTWDLPYTSSNNRSPNTCFKECSLKASTKNAPLFVGYLAFHTNESNTAIQWHCKICMSTAPVQLKKQRIKVFHAGNFIHMLIGEQSISLGIWENQVIHISSHWQSEWITLYLKS